MHNRKRFLVSIPALLVAGPALALEDPLSASSIGSAGTVVADPRNNDAVVKNPAAMALTDRYDLGAYGNLGQGLYQAGANAVDSHQLPQVAMGFGYRYTYANPEFQPEELPGWTTADTEVTNKQRYHQAFVSLAVPLFDRKLAFGLGGSLKVAWKERVGNYTTGSADAGVAWAATKIFSLGANVHDIIPFDEAEPLGVTAGFHVHDDAVGSFAAEADYRIGDGIGKPLSVAVGAVKAVPNLEVRLGWRMDGPTERHYVTGGFGVSSENAWVDYGLMVPVAGAPLTLKNTVHSLGIRFRG